MASHSCGGELDAIRDHEDGVEVKLMIITKFVVKVLRRGAQAPQYVQRICPSPVVLTLNLKLAMAMGKFTAEGVADSMRNSRRIAELVSIQVSA